VIERVGVEVNNVVMYNNVCVLQEVVKLASYYYAEKRTEKQRNNVFRARPNFPM
jgi:hypothetical protein